MRSKRIALVLLLGMFVAAAAICLAIRSPETSKITQANFALIEMGMKRREVEALLGPPEVEVQNWGLPDPASPGTVRFLLLAPRQFGKVVDWIGAEGWMIVSFDDEDVVNFKELKPVVVVPSWRYRIKLGPIDLKF